MTERAQELIDMLTILKKNSYSGKLRTEGDFTIIKECKKESFDFAIDQAIAYIHDQDNIYADTDSVKKKTNCYACRFCLCDAEGRSCQLGANKYSEACALFEEA